ncbi:MAG: hypothetical protein QMD14_04920 [Candidatus Aenigmarchaeota archaeon]|nr:hypothetical protein [Candidatus Aenigmarchaeota archaeon]
MKFNIKEIYPQLKKIESEIQVLKILMLQSIQIPKQKALLKGLLSGITISEEEIEEAKKLLFKSSA